MKFAEVYNELENGNSIKRKDWDGKFQMKERKIYFVLNGFEGKIDSLDMEDVIADDWEVIVE